jgi:hypothetical protein
MEMALTIGTARPPNPSIKANWTVCGIALVAGLTVTSTTAKNGSAT